MHLPKLPHRYPAACFVMYGIAGCMQATWALAAPPPRIAVFGFSLNNTSPAPSTPEELARVDTIEQQFIAAVQQSRLYRPIQLPANAALKGGAASIESCNGCERAPALAHGAPYAAYGWVQKVSNLILNLNVVIEDSRTGRMLAGGSVDIRGNTAESWRRGMDFLLQEHVLPAPPVRPRPAT